MATVFVGRHRDEDGVSRLVALKRAHRYVRSTPDVIDALRREARLGSYIHHPNVVGVQDVEDEDGEVVLVLDYVEGTTLSAIMRRLDTDKRPREMMRILLDTACGLDAVHRATDDEGRQLLLVHRDVSPSNVLIGRDGIARLSDFGIAKTLDQTMERTVTGVLKGKVAYMAPEYVERHRADARSDLFSLGVVAWEVLTGRRLFKGATDFETLRHLGWKYVPPVSDFAPALASLDEIVLRALARDPEHRYTSVGAFANALERHASAANLVGTHEEVAALVESLFGAELTERRRLLTEEVSESSVDLAPERDTKTPIVISLSHGMHPPVVFPGTTGFIHPTSGSLVFGPSLGHTTESSFVHPPSRGQLGVLSALLAAVFVLSAGAVLALGGRSHPPAAPGLPAASEWPAPTAATAATVAVAVTTSIATGSTPSAPVTSSTPFADVSSPEGLVELPIVPSANSKAQAPKVTSSAAPPSKPPALRVRDDAPPASSIIPGKAPTNPYGHGERRTGRH
ncbi:serine/threonine protein kinase [Pendulispora albinea]|uniref:Serine/threonine protein kinase n=2 Tax=Pendulispora albinea TaxID=2741071 RepID=A0ABZ2LK46_9BACT